MSSWVSHFRTKARRLRVLGMNAEELDANAMATSASSTTSTPTLASPCPMSPSTTLTSCW